MTLQRSQFSYNILKRFFTRSIDLSDISTRCCLKNSCKFKMIALKSLYIQIFYGFFVKQNFVFNSLTNFLKVFFTRTDLSLPRSLLNSWQFKMIALKTVNIYLHISVFLLKGIFLAFLL